jgi:hypothetical protein
MVSYFRAHQEVVRRNQRLGVLVNIHNRIVFETLNQLSVPLAIRTD